MYITESKHSLKLNHPNLTISNNVLHLLTENIFLNTHIQPLLIIFLSKIICIKVLFCNISYPLIYPDIFNVNNIHFLFI